jgi:hypothetical protein
MVLYTVMTRGSTVLAEYGFGGNDYSSECTAQILKNLKPGSRLVNFNSKYAAILNEKCDGDMYSFASVIESQEDRDQAFGLLEQISEFFEYEKKNNPSKITSEITIHMSRQIRTLMVSRG